MNFRIGINVVDVLVKNGDLFGNCVSIAARLEALAEMGGMRHPQRWRASVTAPPSAAIGNESESGQR